MEKQLFSWDDWDHHDTFLFQFYDCKLNVDIGKFKAGSKIASIVVSYEEGILEMYNDEGDKIIEKVSLTLCTSKSLLEESENV